MLPSWMPAASETATRSDERLRFVARRRRAKALQCSDRCNRAATNNAKHDMQCKSSAQNLHVHAVNTGQGQQQCREADAAKLFAPITATHASVTPPHACAEHSLLSRNTCSKTLSRSLATEIRACRVYGLPWASVQRRPYGKEGWGAGTNDPPAASASPLKDVKLSESHILLRRSCTLCASFKAPGSCPSTSSGVRQRTIKPITGTRYH